MTSNNSIRGWDVRNVGVGTNCGCDTPNTAITPRNGLHSGIVWIWDRIGSRVVEVVVLLLSYTLKIYFKKLIK